MVPLEWVQTNYALKLKAPQVKDAPTLPFTDKEMKAVFEAAKESNRFAAIAVYAFILAMRYSGLRISDTTILAKDSLAGNRLKLYTAKTGEHVSMLLPEFVVVALHSVKSSNPKYFFWTGESKLPAAVSVWRKRIAKVFEDAKITDGQMGIPTGSVIRSRALCCKPECRYKMCRYCWDIVQSRLPRSITLRGLSPGRTLSTGH